MAADGTTAAAGAPFRDVTGTVFVHDGLTGSELDRLVPGDGAAGDRFGEAVAIDGPLVVVGSPRHDAAAFNAGAAYLFDVDAGSLRYKLLPPAPRAGFDSAARWRSPTDS